MFLFYQFLVLLNYFKQDQKSLSCSCSDYLCPAGPTSWSGNLLLNRISPNILPLCKVMFPDTILILGDTNISDVTLKSKIKIMLKEANQAAKILPSSPRIQSHSSIRVIYEIRTPNEGKKEKKKSRKVEK